MDQGIRGCSATVANCCWVLCQSRTSSRAKAAAPSKCFCLCIYHNNLHVSTHLEIDANKWLCIVNVEMFQHLWEVLCSSVATNNLQRAFIWIAFHFIQSLVCITTHVDTDSDTTSGMIRYHHTTRGETGRHTLLNLRIHRSLAGQIRLACPASQTTESSPYASCRFKSMLFSHGARCELNRCKIV